MQRIAADGIPVLIPPDSGRRKAPGRAGTAASTTSCADVLATEHGNALYRNASSSSSRCSATPNTTAACNRFHRRGRAAVRTEWRLITATHNLLKLHTPPARAAA